MQHKTSTLYFNSWQNRTDLVMSKRVFTIPTYMYITIGTKLFRPQIVTVLLMNQWSYGLSKPIIKYYFDSKFARDCHGHNHIVVGLTLTLWVRIQLMVRCPWYNIMWWSLSVTGGTLVVFSGYCGFLNQ